MVIECRAVIALKESCRLGPINRKFSRYKGGRARECVNTMCEVDICVCFACRSCAAEKHFRERQTRVCAPSKSNGGRLHDNETFSWAMSQRGCSRRGRILAEQQYCKAGVARRIAYRCYIYIYVCVANAVTDPGTASFLGTASIKRDTKFAVHVNCTAKFHLDR